MNGLYVLKDANNSYVRIDEMSGGYPSRTSEFGLATTWKTPEEANEYLHRSSTISDCRLEKIVSVKTLPVQVTVVMDPREVFTDPVTR